MLGLKYVRVFGFNAYNLVKYGLTNDLNTYNSVQHTTYFYIYILTWKHATNIKRILTNNHIKVYIQGGCFATPGAKLGYP